MTWYYVLLDYACFGIGVDDGIVTSTPPIANWMKGKSVLEIKPWLIKKKAKVIKLSE